MAKTNTKTAKDVVKTHEGAMASRISNHEMLRRAVMSCFLWENSFYENGVAIADRIKDLVQVCDPVFVAELAIEARTTMKLRHVPLWLCVHLAKLGKLKAETLTAVVQRPDELSEFLSLYWKDQSVAERSPISNQVKKGLAKAFLKFNEYSFAKYNGDRDIRLRDVMFLCHPKPETEQQSILFKKLANDELATPDTWEVALSSGADKTATWTRLLLEKKLGALALIRNLRNMVEANVPRPVIKEALANVNVERVLPFRFLAASRHAPLFEPELETLMLAGLAKYNKLPGKTMVVIDVSGSMNDALSGKSEMLRIDAAAGIAIMIREVCDDPVIMVFNNDTRIVPARHGFALRDAIGRPNGGTDTAKAVKVANEQGYDRIIIVTDEQSQTNILNPLTSRAYIINVASYQNGIGYNKWVHINGWSEGVINFIYSNESLSLNSDDVET